MMTMIQMIAKCDPEEFPHIKAKAMIFRCQSMVEEQAISLMVDLA